MKSSIVIILFFAAGITSGLLMNGSDLSIGSGMSNYALHFLLFLIGISIGSDLKVFRIIKKLHFKVLLVPVSVIVGTLAGAAAVSYFISDITLNECLAVGSGFGYYSLSSIYITELRGESLGVVALLSNIIREVITLICAPLLLLFFGKLAPIASGGATSMDTTLPIITRYSGKDYAVISVFSGTVLTVLVPFMVTFFL
ncbi:MAG: lysine exporter LysO family protein [Candidatus Delongbacteria bacterium]|nr:lysine exporter LysO family protein [Candidatus Delongbacteria bacterium]